LWSNVGSIGIASSLASVEFQTGQAEVHIPATCIFALLPRGYIQGLSGRSTQSTAAAARSSHRHLDRQPKSCLFDRLAGWHSGSAENNIFHRHCLACRSTMYSIHVSTVEISVLVQREELIDCLRDKPA